VKLDILAIVAHPDDAELTCGGLLLKMADTGKKTGVIDLTAGELATLGTVELRRQDAERASKILGLAARENLGLPDGRLADREEYKLKIAALIRKYRPHTVILPLDHSQRHPDHAAAGKLGYAACYLAGLEKLDLEGEKHRPYTILYASSFIETKHSFFVDITAQCERKKEAVAAFQSQFDGSEQSRQIYKPGNDIIELMEIYHRKYGIEVGCKYAEPYVIKEPLLIDDPTALRVRSI
jgi:bacillithiol biosynthesis deacetylase BshB1